ncbi:hypothetical protein CspeluHIS016_0104440 [Cutaneotrichosporon spelunceum]|uniref:HECT-type E3 ubiquitin transferase n=1 Tax=Cutaneotrichosporon spelunceum TaxID=1672016 RepID=A0AAD3Y9D1_9TREE|nr:hypothetical protein CspeluHIS016_0104440 [Cutaneotrichosporon spelunceum]
MWNPDGSGRHPPVDLSTQSSSSSSALLGSIRAQREAREAHRRRQAAATTVQRVWRGRTAAAATRQDILTSLESGASVGEGARALLLLLRGRGERVRVARVLDSWTTAALASDPNGPAFRSLLMADASGFGVLLARILRFVSTNPRTETSARLLSVLETFLKPAAYADIPDRAAEVVAALGSNAWVETLSDITEALAAAKRRHALLLPVIRLVTAPSILVPLTPASPLVAPLIHTFLAVPALPSSIPLPSLTHLSATLPLFTVLLPTAAANPSLLSQGRLVGELERTYFLANLATFGITGGMLARSGTPGMDAWMAVLGTLLPTLGDGWGMWAERSVSGGASAVPLIDNDDSEEEAIVSSAPVRARLPPGVAKPLALLASPQHVGTLASHAITAGSLSHFSEFALSILGAFRGSPKWEGTLDALLDGSRGRALVKLLWREGVRGKWSNKADQWTWFSKNPNKPMLLLVTHLFSHYLLLTPDDEFFSTSNPLSLDEVLELSSTWRDLAFWGYLNGVGTDARGAGTEAERRLFTQGVVRITERNGRRKFAPDEHWVMDADLRSGFIDAVKYEDELLETGGAVKYEHGVVAGGTGGDRVAHLQQRMSWRQLANSHVSPRLGLLINLPMAVPFATRLQVFREFIRADRKRLGIRRYGPARHRVEIRRSHLAEDGFRQLNSLGSGLKNIVEITFVDKWGNQEAGIDGGGLFKEFLHKLSKEAFDTERGLWLANLRNELYPNPHSYASEPHQLAWYGFIGRLLGKALYADILVDVTFAGFFLAKWLGRQSHVDDLASLDRELYRGLIQLKNYPHPEELSLTFSVAEDEFGVAKSVDLIPGGSEIPVTAENRHEYIALVCKYKLDRQFAAQSEAFFAGLSDLIDPRWLRMFDQNELAQLLGGEEAPIDLLDLRKHTTVSGFDDERTPAMFWRVVDSFSEDQKRQLLTFVTSCSRPPLLGFAHLNPPFGVRNAGQDKSRLPTASSCANLLKLPDYKDEAMLRAKLLQAITSGAGFDMS